MVGTTLHAGDWEHAPKSSDYAVKEVFKGTLAEVKILKPEDRLYRTILRKQAKKGPNFAGHYRMAAIGCGFDSFFIAVIDNQTGKVYWPPFGCISLAGGFGIPLPEGKGDKPNPAFHVNSRLFVFIGVENREDVKPEDRAAQFWVFDKGKFRLVYSIPAKW